MMPKYKLSVLLLASALLCTACLREAAEISELDGVGRETAGETEKPSAGEADPDNPPETAEGYTPPPLDGEHGEHGEDAPPAADDVLGWDIQDGKYVYTIPPRDLGPQQDLSDMANFSRGPLEDQPDDWYFGKTQYDEATGEVTYFWDRYQSTIDKIDQYGAIYRGDTSRKVCYFTFDCGYEYGPTPSMLDTLKEKNVPGTFFLTGQYVTEEKPLIRRMIDEGHMLGNHTVHHQHGTQLTAQEFVDELQGLEDMYHEAFPDAQPMIYYRPPYGNCNEYTMKLTQKMGYHMVMWSYTYKDYDVDNQLSYDEAMAKVKAGLHPGAVYLFHTESETNALILGDFIDWVRAQGYEILPLCDIHAEQRPAS